MSSACAIADTTPTRADLRLIVLAQWIRAGLALTRAAATGRGLIGGAVALWRLAQAVRLAILLAQRLKQAANTPSAGAPHSGAAGPASTPVPAWSLEAAALDDAALRRAMAELDAAIASAFSAAPQGRASPWDVAWDRERPARIFARATPNARRPHGRRTPPLGLRPLRPPGLDRPGRRRSPKPDVLDATPTPIAPWPSGATRWLRASAHGLRRLPVRWPRSGPGRPPR